jgi:hypothetical protein
VHNSQKPHAAVLRRNISILGMLICA